MYIYRYTCEKHNQELIKYEMNCIFGSEIDESFIFSNLELNPNRSYFINYRIDILTKAKVIENLVAEIGNLKLDYEAFKIEFIDVTRDVMEYRLRIDYCKQIADLIDGYGQMKNPRIRFVVTNVKGQWYFGKLVKNDRSFMRLQSKPNTYSHSMSCELSRTVVNIACGQDQPKLIDPCCGVGTVICEALDLDYNIYGTELNWLVFDKCRANLKALNMPQVIKRQDMHDITGSYDVSILDIPYGLMSKTSEALQAELISKCYQISNKLVLIANEESEHLIAHSKWIVMKKIEVPKSNYKFTRYVYSLKK